MKVISFIAGLLILLIIALSFNIGKKDKPTYYEVISLKEYERRTGDHQDYYESEKAIYEREKRYFQDVVSQEKTAAYVGKVLYRLTSKKNSDIKKYHITLVDKKVWKISIVGMDSLVVYIQKHDGRILRIERYIYPQYRKESYKNKLINTPELAAQIGICYLCDIYGKDVIKEEIPFNIVEFQHSWLLEGTLPPNSYGGVASIYITKKDGMVIDYIHEK